MVYSIRSVSNWVFPSLSGLPLWSISPAAPPLCSLSLSLSLPLSLSLSVSHPPPLFIPFSIYLSISPTILSKLSAGRLCHLSQFCLLHYCHRPHWQSGHIISRYTRTMLPCHLFDLVPLYRCYIVVTSLLHRCYIVVSLLYTYHSYISYIAVL